MVESYNLLLLMQFESFQSNESAAEAHFAVKTKEVDQKLVDINRLRDRLMYERDSMQEVIKGKDREVD